MGKRLEYFNYHEALSKELPIGSGEIESSLRHVMQKRLKIAGARWKIDNANALLNLRTDQLNGNWETHWESCKVAAKYTMPTLLFTP